MFKEWIAMEHYRLHTLEALPSSPYREAAIAAIQSKLSSLQQDPRMAGVLATCDTCQNRKRGPELVPFPAVYQIGSKCDNLAA